MTEQPAKQEQTPATQTEGGDIKPKRGGKEGFGGRGGKGGRQGGRRPMEEARWVPLTSLGRLVAMNIITSLEEIYYHSIPIKEHQIVDKILEAKKVELKEEVMKVKSVQKQTKAGQRTRFKVVMAVGDCNGHLGLGSKLAKEVQTAMKGALAAAKLNIVPIRRGYWGNNMGKPHTVPIKVTGKCGSCRIRLIPAPRGSGVVGAPATRKLLAFAGITDCFTSSEGHTKTAENFLRAVAAALYKTYCYLTPDLWAKRGIQENPFSKYSKEIKNYKEPTEEKPKRNFRGGDRDNRGPREDRGNRRRGGDRDAPTETKTEQL